MGDELRQIIRATQLSHRQFALQLGYSPSTINGWTTGRFLPKVHSLWNIATLYARSQSNDLKQLERFRRTIYNKLLLIRSDEKRKKHIANH
jgi:transcriptional regulator with XRE-family HTH domain